MQTTPALDWLNSCSEAELLEAVASLPTEDLAEARALIEQAFPQFISGPSLAEFVQRTTSLTLDPWQFHLCAVLERVAGQKGARVLIHAPPQHGKSIIVSQRFPAWVLGRDPATRIKLACYNITHAEAFGQIVRNLMWETDYAEMFPAAGLRVQPSAARGSWSTAARTQQRDAQPSFKALGLLTGFVGQGADLLIIDDPYASPQDAASETIRNSVWQFWDESARVRLTEDSNVAVMFHRYHEDDLAGKLWATGEWEMLRYCARADGDAEYGADPLGRPDGEKLSPRFSEAYYATQEQAGWVWLSQFQGRPTAKEGSFFKVNKLRTQRERPEGLREVRAWDLAATEGAGDWTAGVKMATDGRDFFLYHVERGRWASDARNAEMLNTAAGDGKQARIRLPQDPGQAGKNQAQDLVRMLAGYAVKSAPVSGSKEINAEPFAAQVNAGNVVLIGPPETEWHKPFIEELRAFPRGAHDDQVDAASDAFNALHEGGWAQDPAGLAAILAAQTEKPAPASGWGHTAALSDN